MPDKIIREFLENALPYAGFGAFGGMAVYLNSIRNGAKFKLSMFFINAFLSSWIGVTAYTILPGEMGLLKIGLVSVSGFLSYPILAFLETEGLNILLNKVGLGNTKKVTEKDVI